VVSGSKGAMVSKARPAGQRILLIPSALSGRGPRLDRAGDRINRIIPWHRPGRGSKTATGCGLWMFLLSGFLPISLGSSAIRAQVRRLLSLEPLGYDQ